jgi:hypothetical protein
LIHIISSFRKFHRSIPDNYEDDPEYTWENLPEELKSWLQTQDGLKINKEQISSRSMLETVFNLLEYRRESTNKEERYFLTDISILELGIKVAVGYIKQITSKRNAFIRNNTIPGSSTQVIQRRCSACRLYALDDAFPLFCQSMPGRYVIRINFKGAGCGRQGCKGNPSIIPIDPRQKYVAPIKKGFEKAFRAEEDQKKVSLLLRSGPDLHDCPSMVVVKCSGCGCTRQHCGRWTIHDPPRFIQPRLTCSECGKSDTYFRAVDPKIETITEPCLYDTLKGFEKVGCNLSDFPKLPGIIFLKVSYQKRFELLKRARDGLGVDDMGTNQS